MPYGKIWFSHISLNFLPFFWDFSHIFDQFYPSIAAILARCQRVSGQLLAIGVLPPWPPRSQLSTRTHQRCWLRHIGRRNKCFVHRFSMSSPPFKPFSHISDLPSARRPPRQLAVTTTYLLRPVLTFVMVRIVVIDSPIPGGHSPSFWPFFSHLAVGLCRSPLL